MKTSSFLFHLISILLTLSLLVDGSFCMPLGQAPTAGCWGVMSGTLGSHSHTDSGLFSNQAVVEPAIESPLHSVTGEAQAVSVRREQMKAGFSRRSFARLFLAGLTVAAPLAAQEEEDAPDQTNTIIPQFTDQEQRIIREEISAIVRTYAPQLEGREEELFQKFGVLSSALEEDFLSASSWLAIGMAFVAGCKTVNRIGRREALKAAAWGTGIFYYARSYVALHNMITYEKSVSGQVDYKRVGEIKIARHHIRSLTEFRSVAAHELFHYLGYLEMLPRHTLYANSYALLRVLEAEGESVLPNIGIFLNDKLSLEASSDTSAYRIGERLAHEFPDPEERNVELTRVVQTIFALQTFDPDIRSDYGRPWVYFYGIAQGAIAFKSNENFSDAYRYIGRLAKVRDANWPWWQMAAQEIKIDFNKWTPTRAGIYAATAAVSTGLAYGFRRIAETLGRSRWTMNARKGIFIGGLALAFFTWHWPLRGDLYDILNAIWFRIRYTPGHDMIYTFRDLYGYFKDVGFSAVLDHSIILTFTASVVGMAVTAILNIFRSSRHRRPLDAQA